MAISNLFNPKWKNSDPEVRISAVKECDEAEVIAVIALEDEDTEVRLAALKKLEDIPSLEKTLENEKYEYNLNYIKKSLNKLYSEKILSSSNLSESEPYVQKIAEEEVLCKLVTSVDDYDTASLICSKIATESLLAKVAKTSRNKKLCSDIIERISDMPLLEMLSKSAALASAKKDATKKISVSKGEPEALEKEASQKAAYESLCQLAEELSDSTDWEDGEKRFAELKEDWKALEKLPDEGYEVLEKKFESKYSRFTKKKQQVKKDEELKDEKLKILEDLCNQTQQFLEADDFQKKKEAVYKLKKKWKREIEDITYADEITERFSGLTSQYDTKYKALKEDQSRQLVIEKETLSGLTAEIEGFIKTENCLPNIARVKEIEKQWEGTQTDLTQDDDELNATFKKVIKTYFKKLKMDKEVQHWERCEHYVLKLKLCEQASLLLEQTGDMHVVAKSLKELRNEWNAIGDVPKVKAQKIWRKFDAICNKIYEKCKVFYAELDVQKKNNLKLKIALCEKAEALQDRENTKVNADALKKLQREWKEIGAIPRHKERAMFERFRAAGNTFFERRKEAYEKVKVVYDKNKAEKETLCEEAEKIIEMDFREAKAFEDDLKLKWRRIGDVAREDYKELWNKFNEPFVKFRENLMLQAPENLTKKEELCSGLETLLNSISEDLKYKELKNSIKERQDIWASIGPVPEDKEKDITSKYTSVIDECYKKQERFSQEKIQLQNDNLEKKKKLITTLESVFETDNEGSASEKKVEDVKTKWETIGEIPAEKVDEIERQFKGLCDSFSNGNKNFFNTMQKEKEKNLKLKIELCVKAEKLANMTTEDSSDTLDLSSLADELSFAIGSNFIEEKKANPKVEMKKLKENWQKNGDIPVAEETKINERFKIACEAGASR